MTDRMEHDDFEDREMPHSEAAERGVLAYAFQTASIRDLRVVLDPGEFYSPAYAATFLAMRELDSKGVPIDAATVEQAMVENESIGMIAHVSRGAGVAAFASMLLGEITTLDAADWHAQIVRDKARRRRWIAATREICGAGYRDGDDGEYFAQAERRMLETANANVPDRGPVHIKGVLREWVRDVGARYERIRQGNSAATGIVTGLRDFDAITSGLQRQDLIILGARPSMGKTSFALAACEGAAASNACVLVFSCEMSAPSLIERLVSSDGHVDGSRLRSGQLEQQHWVRISNATARLAERPIWIDDDGSVTVDEIRSRARRWRAKHAVSREALIIVDYVQLIESERVRGRNREQEVSAISRGLKALAKELDCPVLALAQLNRDLEKRPDKRPRMADLRDSGGIEQDADVIAFLYRDEVYNEATEDKGIAEVIVAKQRKGPTGVIRLAWLPEFCRFENLSERNSARGAA